MLEFVKTFDLLGSVTLFLQERRQSLGISDEIPFRPRFLNQERGGLLIYTWNDLSEEAKVKGPVTHVGVFDPSTQKHKILWIYNQKVRIVSCTLNREKTLLGFTIVSRQEAGQDGKSKDIYQAFLAELQSQDTRVFSLNLQRHSFLKVQFLSPDFSPSAGSGSASGSSRQSYMLVMLHKESVGLYQIPMARIGDRGIMMSGQPSTEQIVRKFVWCQWDAQNQRLYYIHSGRQSSSHSDSIGHRLSAVQFLSGGKFDNMIDIPINFPFPYIKTSTRVCYADIPLHPGIPDTTLNAVVLSQPNGSMCLCYQEHISSSARPKPAASLMTQPEDDPDATAVDVNYYVCMVHHAKTLHGCATGLPRSVVAGKRVMFQWFGEYLVVSMPGVFCHLLNLTLDFEPCHHILLHNHDIPAMSKPQVPNSSSSQPVPMVTDNSSKLSATTSTDTSDISLYNQATPAEVNSSPRSHEEEDHQSQASGSTSEGMESVKAGNSDPTVSLSHPSQTLIPTPPVPVLGQGSSTPSPPRGLSVSPRVSSGMGELPDTLSVIDGECFQLGMPLIPCFGFYREAGSIGLNLYDAISGNVWRLASNPEQLLKAFRSAYWSTQLAILHYLIMLRTRDIFTIKQVFEVLTADPTVPEITHFLSEYLVASTFASMRKKSDKETTELLTFTAADTFRGQFEKNSQGERLARVTYTSLDSVNISTKMSQERRRRSSEDGWDLLRRSLRLKQMPPPSRFSHERVLKALQKDIESNGSSSKKWTWVNQELEASFFDGMHTVKLTDVPTLRTTGPSSSEVRGSGGRQNRTESALGSTPLFLQATVTGKVEAKKKPSAVTEQLLVSHLLHHMKKESAIKAQNIAREYITCQNQQCQQLCHLLWSIHTDEETTAYESLLPNLKEVGTDREYQLFQTYERVFLVTQDLAFPRPPGFSSYFTSLGFKCLSTSVFLQYVDRGILHLTPDFILQLLHDLPDNADENNAEIKFHIISRLPKPFADDCLQRWHHPLLLKAVAQHQVAQILQEGLAVTYRRPDGSLDVEDRIVETRSRSMTSPDTSSVTSAETMSFKPLTIFIKHLEDTALEIQRQKPGSMSLMYDTNIIEEAALSFTTSQRAQFDLSNTNF